MTDTDRDTEARGPIGSYALKHDYTFLVADSLGDVRGGVDGLFRFTADGLVQRGLAVLEVQPQGNIVVSPAPRDFRDFSF